MAVNAAEASNGQTVMPMVEKDVLSQVESGHAAVIIDAETNKALLRRIDRRVMPVVREHQDSDTHHIQQLKSFLSSALHMPSNTTTKHSLARLPYLVCGKTWVLKMV